MEVLNYLRTHSLDQLTEEFGIKVRLYPDHDLAVLNYDQLESPRFHPIVRECRGLIINTRYLHVISRTFPRFFNFNEDPNEVFDFDDIKRVEEKADGSLMSVYHYRASWHVASRGTAFAESTTATGLTLKEIFEEAIGTDVNSFMAGFSPEFNHVFELCSLHNKVVKIYEKPVVYYLTRFHVKSGAEYHHHAKSTVDNIWNDSNYNGVDSKKILLPKIYELKSVDEIVESFRNIPATDEGYVLVDGNGNRLKIKNPAYIDLHHLKGNGELTPNRITDIVFRGETEEVLSYFPEYRPFFEPFQKSYDTLIKEVDKYTDLVYNMDISQKEFALLIQSLPFKSVLFSMRSGKSLQEAFDKLSTSGRTSLLLHWYSSNKKQKNFMEIKL